MCNLSDTWLILVQSSGIYSTQFGWDNLFNMRIGTVWTPTLQRDLRATAKLDLF